MQMAGQNGHWKYIRGRKHVLSFLFLAHPQSFISWLLGCVMSASSSLSFQDDFNGLLLFQLHPVPGQLYWITVVAGRHWSLCCKGDLGVQHQTHTPHTPAAVCGTGFTFLWICCYYLLSPLQLCKSQGIGFGLKCDFYLESFWTWKKICNWNRLEPSKRVNDILDL